MNHRSAKLIACLLVCQMLPVASAQEKNPEANGVFTLGYSRTHTTGKPDIKSDSNTGIDSRGRNLGIGLDLNLSAYLLDPRFIKLSFETSFFRDKGASDDTEARYGNTGVGFYLNVLPTSPYPFRFHYTKQNSSFLQKDISSSNAGRSSIGFDWALRKPKYPTLTVNYDKSSYDSKFLARSGFKSRARVWNLSLTDDFKGWDINSSYSNQSTAEEVTKLNTHLNFLRFDAHRQVFKKSNLAITSFYEKLRFEGEVTRLAQDFSFLNLHTDFNTRHTDKLSTRLAYQFYHSVNEQRVFQDRNRPVSSLSADVYSVDIPSPQASPLMCERGAALVHQRQQREEVERRFFESERRKLLEEGRKTRRALEGSYKSDLNTQASVTGAVNETAAFSPLRAVTSFNSIDGQITYRLMREITVSGTLGARSINPPDDAIESATRFLDLTAAMNWNKKFKLIDTRAGLAEGLTEARSNFGEVRRIRFRSLSAGLNVGEARYALISADYDWSSRPDVFQIGGFASQQRFTMEVESYALRGFHLRVSAGQNRLVYLTTRGREELQIISYSGSLDQRLFTLLVSHNTNIGVRDSFLIPLPSDRNRIFRALPIEALTRDPLLNTSGIYTFGLLRVKPTKDLDIDIRYLKDKAFFARTNDVFAEQFDLLIRYRLGKFTFTGGAVFQQQRTEGLFFRDRAYYFFRLSRPFKII
ncbi:MAG: hypothetical protein HY231_01010 [Acidobacteria bacterium]|nr:hypothetical protein [Acidobacteriota bacterium]